MQTKNPILDDIARVATGALGAVTGMRAEIESRVRDQLERFLGRMDLVTREEFDAVRAMAGKARTEQERLEQRLAAAEARLQLLETAAGSSAAEKSSRHKSKPRGGTASAE